MAAVGKHSEFDSIFQTVSDSRDLVVDEKRTLLEVIRAKSLIQAIVLLVVIGVGNARSVTRVLKNESIARLAAFHKGGQVTFRGATVTPVGKQVLRSVAALMRDRSLIVRVEVHVPLGTRSKRQRDVVRQKQQDRLLTIKRATAVLEFLASQGVPLSQIQAAGLGSDRPLGNNAPTDPANERVDFIKAQQRTP